MDIGTHWLAKLVIAWVLLLVTGIGFAYLLVSELTPTQPHHQADTTRNSGG
jgi:hypothetical protein